MKTLKLIAAVLAAGLFALSTLSSAPLMAKSKKFVRIEGPDLVRPDGSKLFIAGTNLGNWLNPEGYMFGFSRANCEWLIDQMVKELAGPDFAKEFWKAFKDNYITQADIEFIASTGANTIRVPFNYKLFTDEDYMGLSGDQDGFERIDRLVEWCRNSNLYVILDMHDAPGGQTGHNIDNSYGYPWLFESEASQRLFCEVWQKIAKRYRNEPAVLGYELLNEPIAPFFPEKDELNAKLEPTYKRAVKAIREVDKNHIILLGGSQWNGNFEPLKDTKFDSKIMFTCHRYGGKAEKSAIQNFIDFRDKAGLPMYMGEIGHGTDEWQAQFCKVMRENNIGYTFWPYKKVDNSCMAAIVRPEGWNDIIVKFAESPRSTLDEIIKIRPDQATARKLLMEFVGNSRFSNCKVQDSYIGSMTLNK